MTNVYMQAFDIIEQTKTEIDFHKIVTMILKQGYNQTLITLIEKAA